MKKLRVLTLLILIISGCQKEPIVSYAPPTDLAYDVESEIITWLSDDNVTGFVLSINDELFELSDKSFDFKDYPSGEYVIKVKALYGEEESRYTFPLRITLTKTEFMTIMIDDLIRVDEISGAEYYNFEVFNSLNESIFIQNSPLQVLEYDDFQGLIKVEAKATFSAYTISNYAFLFDTDGYVYEKDTDGIILDVDTVIHELFIDDTILEPSKYIQNNQELMISSTYLDTLADGTYLIKIQSTLDYYTFLTITSVEKPTIVSTSIVEYNNSDLTFEFDLKGGTFNGLSAQPGLTSLDYDFTGNTLTINQSYIDQVITNEPSRNSIIFAYVISNGPYSIIGYITVNI